MSDLVWMAGIALAVVVFLIFVRRWSYNIAIDFECDGKAYRAHRNGHFTDEYGTQILDPDLLARFVPCAEAAKRARFREMDSQQR